uniref:Uncharacterized protein n=1 Tax=Anopheles melas TaxID=34690 RepID=A0A182U7V8_9DIPT
MTASSRRPPWVVNAAVASHAERISISEGRCALLICRCRGHTGTWLDRRARSLGLSHGAGAEHPRRTTAGAAFDGADRPPTGNGLANTQTPQNPAHSGGLGRWRTK